MSDQTTQVARTRITADERRRRLLAASLRVMKREGIAAATTRAICAEAGMPHGAFHYCFRGKRELYAALLASDIEFDLEATWPEISPEVSAGENIQRLLFAYWSQVEADPEAQLVLFDLGSFVLRDPELRELPHWGHRASLEKIAGYVARLGVEADLTFTRGEGTLAELVAATLNGVVWSWLAHRDDEAARESLARFAELVAEFTRKRDPGGPAQPDRTPTEDKGRP
ncbi:TetR/AcrR family transcriptional regulator [Spiractinospora alimapuensis]|uniref:TetR/AcrR family transcriptional regulator n=1 Tax=Spiractinospora alimapuensis TaxID=2820884 RepID=UPI001F47CE6B|nr:TetR/AcrR family transcriptional regulator [Spiractinospora alimapuensis]QVQ52791.1 TetR/AcrR family transcriptional regulator [Spiractinospora alimapuensis]